jgi:hypothetical protein
VLYQWLDRLQAPLQALNNKVAIAYRICRKPCHFRGSQAVPEGDQDHEPVALAVCARRRQQAQNLVF